MQKVFVGLSGGVDSAVSAALLKEHGYDVTGVFIKIWQPEFIECTWREDRLDAMRAAAALRIPFREIDLSREYKEEVVDSMVRDYAQGITPNPDIACNRSIKFGHFAKWARKEGADAIATGHYARIKNHADVRNLYTLLRGKDKNKDQSYFLYQLRADDLAHTLFPIGDFTKTEVRALARTFKLPNAEKPDSQGICFLGDVSMEEFLSRFIPLERGLVINKARCIVGEHRGAALYTVGQRHGYVARGGVSTQHYVIAVDIHENTVTVSPIREDALRTSVPLMNMHWIYPVALPLEVDAQARYRETPVRVRVEQENKQTQVVFAEPHLVSAGQSVVFYDGERCLGGGIIAQ